ncbi:class 1b ribonucleoside-diphosphate reductase subunit beta [Candidatus Phytoplasma melaleucae]|uniref:ribonucleoside-diphosphate reductase n=1 Tax=Candidatus Phytoplasma melaleucae TaxID=2982630 RepID=A0ABT9DFB0_9MOLU|nr:class 1b ribonucleoside-diphosphate reductase subunit beta ['Melaleuca sp.' phytoplasma]MDO8167951.1 class 1b ribonucleoside-diphosphate reductase subunit beta ['Melaleuca sp.' phytoplasma]MDV3205413.1 class 1b ribonucleoside-diphosphate reductase subunit beta [Weeping tea tree witches'-broom phytoplasma]
MEEKKIIYQGANWNNLEDDFTQYFYEQNLSQFWRPEDISLQSDLHVWNELSEQEKKAYSRNLLVLTFLDTYQGDIGMPVMVRACLPFEHQKKATLNFMGAMENAVHAKSYSNIFMTFLNKEKIDDLFLWGERQMNLQVIIKCITDIYEDLERNITIQKSGLLSDINIFNEIKWKSMVASVFLETWLFYSGFYHPLYYYGQGKLMQAGEIINLIIRDESVHGLYIGRLAKELYLGFDTLQQLNLKKWLFNLLEKLYKEQKLLTYEIYNEINLVEDVNVFIRYNANKALLNLGFEQKFPQEEVNPVIINGLNTETKTMDYFSMKGNGYQKMVSESLKDEDFIFYDEHNIK